MSNQYRPRPGRRRRQREHRQRLLRAAVSLPQFSPMLKSVYTEEMAERLNDASPLTGLFDKAARFDGLREDLNRQAFGRGTPGSRAAQRVQPGNHLHFAVPAKRR